MQSALEGLRDWFRICRAARWTTFVAMPSRAADAAWHEFILFTRDYSAFCDRAFRHMRWRLPGLGDDAEPIALRRAGAVGGAAWVTAGGSWNGSGCGGGATIVGGDAGGSGGGGGFFDGGGGGCGGGCGGG